MKHTKITLVATGLVAALLVANLLLASPLANAGGGNNNAANKTHIDGSTVEFLHADLMDGGDEGVTILSTTMKLSDPKDLLLSVTLECALWTMVTSSTYDEAFQPTSEARAAIHVWIEIDGKEVGIGGDDGRITFCDRVHRQTVYEDPEDDEYNNVTMEQYLATKNANAFTWHSISPSAGAGAPITIEVKADVEAYVSPEGGGGMMAEGAVGKRTLTVEVVDL